MNKLTQKTWNPRCNSRWITTNKMSISTRNACGTPRRRRQDTQTRPVTTATQRTAPSAWNPGTINAVFAPSTVDPRSLDFAVPLLLYRPTRSPNAVRCHCSTARPRRLRPTGHFTLLTPPKYLLDLLSEKIPTIEENLNTFSKRYKFNSK